MDFTGKWIFKDWHKTSTMGKQTGNAELDSFFCCFFFSCLQSSVYFRNHWDSELLFKHCEYFQLFSDPPGWAKLKSRCTASFSTFLLSGSQVKSPRALQSASATQAGKAACEKSVLETLLIGKKRIGKLEMFCEMMSMLQKCYRGRISCLSCVMYSTHIFRMKYSPFEWSILKRRLSIICKLQSTKCWEKSSSES